MLMSLGKLDSIGDIMWKEEIKKQNQLQKNIEGFVNDIDSIQRRLEEMTRFVPIPPRAGKELRKVFKALDMAEEALRDMQDESQNA